MPVGLKVMLIAQVPCAARLAPQVLVWVKSPLTGIALIFTVAAPSLITFTILARLAVPTFRALNFKLAGEISNAPGVAGAGAAAPWRALLARACVPVARA